MSDLVLPAVDGWPPPPEVTMPLYELVDWAGPQWLVLWDGNEDDGLRLVRLMYCDPQTKRSVVEVLTYAKQPARDLGNGDGVRATSLGEVASNTVFHLLAKMSERLPQQDRRAWEREREERVVAATELSAPDALVWSAVILAVESEPVPGYRLTIDDGWAICLDAGKVFLTAWGVWPYEAAFQQIADLQAYPMPTDEHHPYDDEPVEPEWEASVDDDGDSHPDNEPFEFPPPESVVVHPPSAERIAGWGDFPRAGRRPSPVAAGEPRQFGLDQVATSRLPIIGVVALPITELAVRLGLRTDRLSDGQFDCDVAYFEVDDDAYFLRQWTVEVVTEVYGYVVADSEGSFAGRPEMRRFMTLAGLVDKQVLLLPPAATGGT
jgi:hypothetical protein